MVKIIQPPPVEPAQNLRETVSDAILDVVLRIPPSRLDEIPNAHYQAHQLARSAARQASLLAGSMALPPGILGWMTIPFELVGVWRVQAQMVSDIAALFGKNATLSREQMVYCLFKHVSAQLFRDVVVRVGERYVVQRASIAVLQNTAQKLGIKIAQGVIGKGASRLVPLVGALGVSAYAYFDTMQVARTAVDLFARDIVVE